MAGRIRIIVVHQPLIYDQCMSAKTGTATPCTLRVQSQALSRASDHRWLSKLSLLQSDYLV